MQNHELYLPMLILYEVFIGIALVIIGFVDKSWPYLFGWSMLIVVGLISLLQLVSD